MGYPIFTYYTPKKDETIVILGAMNGKTCLWFADKMEETGLILAVEPELNNLLEMIKNFMEDKHTNIILVPFAIWDKNEQVRLYLSNRSENHSVRKELIKGKKRGEVFVYGIRWDKLMEVLSLTEVHFCKCNIEGSEIQFLKGMTSVFPNTIAIQWHVDSDIEYIKKQLEKKGYKKIEKHNKEGYIWGWKELNQDKEEK